MNRQILVVTPPECEAPIEEAIVIHSTPTSSCLPRARAGRRDEANRAERTGKASLCFLSRLGVYSDRHAGDDDAKRERGQEWCAFENEQEIDDDDDGCAATSARDDDDDACVGWG